MNTLDQLRRTAEAADSRFRLHHVRVAAVHQLSPTFVRVTVTGPELDRVAPTGFDQRIKVLFPLPGVGLEPVTLTADWYDAWRALPNERRNPTRTYTIRRLRPADREMDIDVVRHGRSGPAGRWAEDVEPGHELIINAPNAAFDGDPGGVDFDPPADCRAVLLAGDETAAPAIAAILEHLPSDCRGVALLELPDPDDADVLPQHRGIDVRVFTRPGARGAALRAAVQQSAAALAGSTAVWGQHLEDVDVDTDLLWEVPRAVTGRPPHGGACYGWLAGEAGVIKQLRRHLVSDIGWDRRSVAFMGYWRQGKAEDNP